MKNLSKRATGDIKNLAMAFRDKSKLKKKQIVIISTIIITKLAILYKTAYYPTEDLTKIPSNPKKNNYKREIHKKDTKIKNKMI